MTDISAYARTQKIEEVAETQGAMHFEAQELSLDMKMGNAARKPIEEYCLEGPVHH